MTTVQPSNSSELQLYHVLQRANLLKYFETFITQGGDDVQQLCEAGEDEFLEIMALVGMASKPLHVRRLQKALQEWVSNPAAFQVPKKCLTNVMPMNGSSPNNSSPSHTLENSSSLLDFKVTPPQSSTISTSTPWRTQARGASPSDGSNLDDPSSSDSQQGDVKDTKDFLYSQGDQTYLNLMGVPQSMLLNHQINAIATAAAVLAQDLPPFEPKPMPKKQINTEIMAVMQMSPDDPFRMNALRRYAAIYGRFDSKRKNDRPMSLHEISVNEAAAQLCSHFPALLTRREELFPLARQVVRDSGYQYSKGHSRCAGSRAADILIQPKLEPGEAVPSTSTFMLITHEDSLANLQIELSQLTQDLSELTKEQDCIRSALRVLLEANDHDQMKKLTAEMDKLNDKQTAMTKRKQRLLNKIAKYSKTSSKGSSQDAPGQEPVGRDSPAQVPQTTKVGSNLGRYGNGGLGYNEELLTSNPLNTLYMAALQNHKDSLFEEGLRIAAQYGMSDFANELIGMKSTTEEIGNKDSGNGVTSEGGNNLGYQPYSSSSLPSSYSENMKSSSLSSSLYSLKENGQSMKSYTSASSPSPMGLSSSNNAVCHTFSSNNHFNTPNNKQKQMYYPSSDVVASPADVSPAVDSDSLATNQNIPTTGTIISEGNFNTTDTVSFKSSNVTDIEATKSSKRKIGELNYYQTNGGEKRFCSENYGHDNVISNEYASRLSPLSSGPSVSLAVPSSASTDYKKIHSNGDSFPGELHCKSISEIPKGNSNNNDSQNNAGGASVNNVAALDDSDDSNYYDKRGMRKKGRV